MGIVKDWIPKQNLDSLKSYKYSAVDKSILVRLFLGKFWNTIIHVFPMWMAPNLITLLGLCFIIVNVITLLIYSPDLTADCPPWVYYSFSAGIFLYATFDALDGKQARRTGTSSPLGELFDHGVDSLNTCLGCIITAHVLNNEGSWYLALNYAVALTYFYLSTWETYYTGTLFLGYVNGPVEGTMSLSAAFLLTGIYGRQLWKSSIKSLIPLSWVPDIQLNTFALIFLGLSTSSILVEGLRRVVRHQNKFHKNVSDALVGLLPITIFLIFNYVWLSVSKMDILKDHLIIFSLANTCQFSMIVAKIIINHLVHLPFPVWNIDLVLIVIGSLNSVALSLNMWTPFSETEYIWLFCLVSLFSYSYMTLSVINQLCTYLDIYCLTIKKKKEVKNN